MKMKNKNLLQIVIAVMTFIGCQQKSDNTTTGNPFVSVAATSSANNTNVAKIKPSLLDLILPRAIAYPPPPTLLDAAGNTIVIQSVWVNFGKIEFKYDEIASGFEVDGDSIEFSGTYTVDLLSNTPASFVSGPISLSQMRRIKFKLIRLQSLPVGAPAGFLNKSIYIQGTVNGNSFTYSTEDEAVIEVAGPQLVSAIANRTLLLELHIANLIKKTNLSAVVGTTNITDGNRVPSANPCSTIDTSASDLFTCFRKGIETESNLGRDDDGDFQLDPQEEKVKN